MVSGLLLDRDRQTSLILHFHYLTTYMSASRSFYCRAREFARKYPQHAEKVLSPSVYSRSSDRYNVEHVRSLEDYLRIRQWRMNEIPENLRGSACDLLSHTLSYPLTLSLFARKLIQTYSKKIESNDKNAIRICCLGARAEATLPLQFWREFLFAMDIFDRSGVFSPSRWVIDFVGPETIMRKTSQQIFAYSPKDTSYKLNRNSELYLNFYNGYLQDTHLNESDGYIMFNPGIGHPHLKDGWKETLNILLSENPNKKPLFLTAHSDEDQVRDTVIIKETLEQNGIILEGGMRSRYHCNPFASRMGTLDPFSPSNTVYANTHYCFLHDINM